eukprot:scaffold1648_cov115-Cylindrotheca_fusiformis.AAC.7
MAASSDICSSESVSDCLSDRSEKGSITFSTIVVYEHAIILGHGPASSGGPTLEIDWEPQAESTIQVDEYESMRSERRKKHQLLMPGSVRTSLLLDSGYTMRDIHEKASGRSSKKSSIKGSIKKTLSSIMKSR